MMISLITFHHSPFANFHSLIGLHYSSCSILFHHDYSSWWWWWGWNRLEVGVSRWMRRRGRMSIHHPFDCLTQSQWTGSSQQYSVTAANGERVVESHEWKGRGGKRKQKKFRNLYCNFWYLVSEWVHGYVNSERGREKKSRLSLFSPSLSLTHTSFSLSIHGTDQRVCEEREEEERWEGERASSPDPWRCLWMTPESSSLLSVLIPTLLSLFPSISYITLFPTHFFHSLTLSFHFFTRKKSSFTSDLQNNVKFLSLSFLFFFHSVTL